MAGYFLSDTFDENRDYKFSDALEQWRKDNSGMNYSVGRGGRSIKARTGYARELASQFRQIYKDQAMADKMTNWAIEQISRGISEGIEPKAAVRYVEQHLRSYLYGRFGSRNMLPDISGKYTDAQLGQELRYLASHYKYNQQPNTTAKPRNAAPAAPAKPAKTAAVSDKAEETKPTDTGNPVTDKNPEIAAAGEESKNAYKYYWIALNNRKALEKELKNYDPNDPNTKEKYNTLLDEVSKAKAEENRLLVQYNMSQQKHAAAIDNKYALKDMDTGMYLQNQYTEDPKSGFQLQPDPPNNKPKDPVVQAAKDSIIEQGNAEKQARIDAAKAQQAKKNQGGGK